MVDKIKTGLVWAYIEAEQFDAASLLIQQIARSSPEVAGHLLFVSCLKQRDYERASAALIYSLVTVPGVDHVGTSGLPMWLLSTGDRTSVKRCVQVFCERATRGASMAASPVIEADLAATLEKAGMRDGAIAVVKATFSEADSPIDTAGKLSNLGAFQYRAAKYREAIDTFKASADLAGAVPDEYRASAQYLEGLCFEELGDIDSARECMSAVIERYPNTEQAPVARQHLAIWAKKASGK
jgi:tetratricopeptide (TPR) repeat protein